MTLILRGARLVDAHTDHAAADLSIVGTQIHELAGTVTASQTIVDVSDMLILPGFIDVHTHGGGGFQLHTTDITEIHNYARWVAKTGVTSFLVAVVGTPNAIPEAQIRVAVEAIDTYKEGAEPLGIFLEGPYINVKRRGAHPPAWLRKPDPKETERILTLTKEKLRLITLAPELPDAEVMIRRLIENNITVSMGHTDATYEETRQAIDWGVTHMTHCFNAMPPLHHRNPGPLAAVAESDTVRGEMIADGIHVHPAVMRVIVKLLSPQRTVVITDAQAGAGVPNAVFEFAGQVARSICGAARLEDGTLTGSILTLDQALRNILEINQVSLSEASAMLTYNAAQAVKQEARKGLLRPGYDADLAIFDKNLQLQATVCCGQFAYMTEAFAQRLSH